MALKPMVIFVDDGQGHGGFPVDPGYGVQAPPAHPSQGLPSGGLPPRPDQSLPPIPTHKPAPDDRPAQLPSLPQGAFIVVWAPGQGWIAVPVNAHPDQSLPGGRPPHASGQPVPGQPGHPSTQPTPPQPTPTPQGRR